jgi:isochorismate synthase EntC
MRPNSTFAAVVGLFAGAGAFVGSASQAEATETELASAIAVTIERILDIPSSRFLFF